MFLLGLLAFVLVAVDATAASAGANKERYLVRAGTKSWIVGEYVIRQRNVRLLDAYRAYGNPDKCVPTDQWLARSHWPRRGLRVRAATLGGMPSGENGCISPDLIYVVEIRLSDNRWRTAFGLRVGDRTIKLRRLYPNARFVRKAAREARPLDEYWLVTAREPCIGVCPPGVKTTLVPRLTAVVENGRVVAFSVPVRGAGE